MTRLLVMQGSLLGGHLILILCMPEVHCPNQAPALGACNSKWVPLSRAGSKLLPSVLAPPSPYPRSDLSMNLLWGSMQPLVNLPRVKYL